MAVETIIEAALIGAGLIGFAVAFKIRSRQ
jgi:hypothetical protein